MFSSAESNNKELSDCEGMVLYHIQEWAKLSRGCVSELLKFTKSVVNTPEVILDPFLLAVLLSLSTISAYDLQVRLCLINHLRTLILYPCFARNYSQKNFTDQNNLTVHKWYNNLTEHIGCINGLTTNESV